MKTHTFRSHTFKIIEGPSEAGGICDAPSGTHKEIIVTVEGDTLHDLQTLIHEGLHACCWDLDEECVASTADDIGRFLWRLGWRKE